MPTRFTFTFRDGSGSVTGPVRGAGGFILSEDRLRIAAERAAEKRPTGLYEPIPGSVAVYPDYSAEGDGAPYTVSLRGAHVEAGVVRLSPIALWLRGFQWLRELGANKPRPAQNGNDGRPRDASGRVLVGDERRRAERRDRRGEQA